MSAKLAYAGEPAPRLLRATPSVDPDSVTIEVSARVEGHAGWTELEATGLLTPFQTQAWLRPWYRLIAPALEAEPAIVTLRDRVSGRALMVLPLCRRRDRGLRVVEFAGIGVSDYNAPILAAGFQPKPDEVVALLGRVRRALGGADLMRLTQMPARAPAPLNPLAAVPQSRAMGFSAWGIPLPPTRQRFEEELDPSFRKEVRRKTRRLAGRGKVDLSHAPTPDEARAYFAELRRQRAARFAELGRTDILGDPLYCRFYEAALFDEPDPVASMAALRADGEIVATMFGLQHRGTYSLVMSAFDAVRWKSCSPGVLAIDAMLTSLIERGFTLFDLTIGDEAYKRDFGAQEQQLFEADLAASWRGAPAILRGHAKAMLKRTLPEPVLARLRR